MDITIDDPLIGALVSERYRIHARVSCGGMATVYTAVDERLGRTVAIKIIQPTQANDPRFVEKFIDETKSIARLTHPNVVAVYDQGTHQGLAYLVMEHARGSTLRDLLIQRQRLTTQDALTVLEQILAAIAAAHRIGLVHRDVKPDNILVSSAPDSSDTLVDSVVKVTDFGLAKAVEASTQGEGHLMATAAYVAPELISEGRSDPRTDVYSAGIVLFEMLTGTVPYDAATSVDLAWKHVYQDVPAPSQLVPGLSPAVDHLVVKATNRNPANRPTDAGAMLAEVHLVREEIEAEPAPSHSTTRTTIIVPHAEAATTVIPTVPDAYHEHNRDSWSQPRTPSRPSHSRSSTTYQRGSFQQKKTLTSLIDTINGDPQMRRKAIAVLAAVALLMSVGIWWLGFGRYTEAPSLVNLPKDQAVSKAEKAGFTVKMDSARFDEQIAKDAVVIQRPPPGERVVSGGAITITLSKGPERYVVPDVAGKPFDFVEQDLKQIRITIKRVDEYDDNVPAGNVIATDPSAGAAIKPGAELTIRVSKGRAPITVPNVVGKNAQDAEKTLTRLGLTVEIQEQDSTKPKDQVLKQDPVDGSGAERGAKITLTVSKGPERINVPDVRNKKADDAKKELESLGFSVDIIGSKDGTVRIQDPQPGTQVEQGSKVRILAVG